MNLIVDSFNSPLLGKILAASPESVVPQKWKSFICYTGIIRGCRPKFILTEDSNGAILVTSKVEDLILLTKDMAVLKTETSVYLIFLGGNYDQDKQNVHDETNHDNQETCKQQENDLECAC